MPETVSPFCDFSRALVQCSYPWKNSLFNFKKWFYLASWLRATGMCIETWIGYLKYVLITPFLQSWQTILVPGRKTLLELLLAQASQKICSQSNLECRDLCDDSHIWTAQIKWWWSQPWFTDENWKVIHLVYVFVLGNHKA